MYDDSFLSIVRLGPYVDELEVVIAEEGLLCENDFALFGILGFRNAEFVLAVGEVGLSVDAFALAL